MNTSPEGLICNPAGNCLRIEADPGNVSGALNSLELDRENMTSAKVLENPNTLVTAGSCAMRLTCLQKVVDGLQETTGCARTTALSEVDRARTEKRPVDPSVLYTAIPGEDPEARRTDTAWFAPEPIPQSDAQARYQAGARRRRDTK
jgi:hypothetical protein